MLIFSDTSDLLLTQRIWNKPHNMPASSLHPLGLFYLHQNHWMNQQVCIWPYSRSYLAILSPIYQV